MWVCTVPISNPYIRRCARCWGSLGGYGTGFGWGWRWLVFQFVKMNDDTQLGVLNIRPELNSSDFLNQFIIDEENDFNIFNDIHLSSIYYNIESFAVKCKSINKPIIISLNIQSLQSKFNELVSFIECLSNKNIFIDIIALQEIWAVPYPESLCIPGYHNIITNCRLKYRGGGVGFYIRNHIEFEILKTMSPFHEKIFESLSVKVKFRKNKFILTNIYRSPNPHPPFRILMPKILSHWSLTIY